MSGTIIGSPADDPPQGVITFLLTDIEGSTALWEAHPEAMRVALARHDAIIARAVRAHHGQLVRSKGEGDSTFSVFATASDAARAAIDALRALACEPWPEHLSMHVRMGIHTGEAQFREGDYYGSAVNRAARLRELAHGGQAVLSQAAADLLEHTLPDDGELIDLGEHHLRDLSRPERVFQLAHPDLEAHFPPLRAHRAEPTNLPASTSSFVGRDHELADVASALDLARVVTLTGVGGVGKTRLALEAAARALPSYRDGVWMVDLAPTVDAAIIVEVVATALGVTQRPGQTLAGSLLDFLSAKHLILLLDNCEHLLDTVASFVDGVVSACPHVRVLATSREGLGIRGERIIAVPPLRLPAGETVHPDDDAEAVRLFVARAAEAKAGFALTAQNRAAIIQLCRRLDGIPLAIELAAARVRSLAPRDLAMRLDERFRLLAGGPRTAVERHQTLRRAIDWSYDLLSEAEQRVLNRLCVFAGSFDLEAAEAVLPDHEADADDLVELLGRLVDKSLLAMEERDGNTRYRLLETIRSYAQDRLEASDEVDVFRGRHAEHYARLATSAGDGLRSKDEVTWTRRIDADLDNLRAVLAWAVATDDADLALRLTAPLAIAGTRGGYASAPWAQTAIALSGASLHPLYPEVLAWAGYAEATAGNYDRAVQLTKDACERAQTMSVPASAMLQVLIQSAIVAMWAGRLDDLAISTEKWLGTARSAGSDFYLAGGLNMSGTTMLVRGGDVSEARALFDDSLAAARRLGNPSLFAQCANMAAECRIETEPERARALLDESLDAAALVDNKLAMGIAIAFSVYLYLAREDWREAAQRVLLASQYMYRSADINSLRSLCLPAAATVLAKAGADEAAARVYGAVRTEAVSDQVERSFSEALAGLRGRLGDDALTAYTAEGAAMDDYEIVALIEKEIGARLAPHA